MTKDPDRLAELRDDLAAGIREARGAVPTDARLTALAERLARAGVVFPVDRAAPPPAEASAASSTGAFKLVVGAVSGGAAAIAIAIAFSLRTTEPPPVPRTAPVEPAVASSVAPVVSSTPGTAARRVDPKTSEAVEQETPPAPSIEATPLPDEATASPPAQQRAASANEGPVLERTAPRSRAPALAAEPGPTTRGDVKPTREPPPASELELLQRARAALAGAPSHALELAERCRSDFPRGSFAPEREIIAISALVRLGRRPEAATRAAAFRRNYPRSAYSQQIDRLIEGR